MSSYYVPGTVANGDSVVTNKDTVPMPGGISEDAGLWRGALMGTPESIDDGLARELVMNLDGAPKSLSHRGLVLSIVCSQGIS